MSKIIKHTFEIPKLTVENGELVEGDPTKITYTFTLLFKGFGIFEELHGSPLFSALIDLVDENGNDTESVKKMFSSSTIKDLAAASYVKIVGDKFHNNRATAEEFRKSQVYPLIENDYDFVTKLSTMAMECVYDEQKNKLNNRKEANRSKK